jgi:hypothetical protein
VELEKHYTPVELAKMLGKHPSTIRDWFRSVPGVVLDSKPSRRQGKKLVRRYSNIMVPASVLERWLAKRTNK